MKFENTEVWGFKHAIRGMRNPKNSWDRSDSYDCEAIYEEGLCGFCDEPQYNHVNCKEIDKCGNYIAIGPNDMKLMKALIHGGPEHRKFMRQIFVSVDITAPLYWWKEFDTYKVGTVANSTSTMHKLLSKPVTLDCFETDDYDADLGVPKVDQSDLTEYGKEVNFVSHWHMDMLWDWLLEKMEDLRQASINEQDPVIAKKLWKELVRILPNGWLQTRTVTLNYEVIYAQIHQRKDHKQNEWSGKDDPTKPNFIAWAKTLPYAEDLLFDDINKI